MAADLVGASGDPIANELEVNEPTSMSGTFSLQEDRDSPSSDRDGQAENENDETQREQEREEDELECQAMKAHDEQENEEDDDQVEEDDEDVHLGEAQLSGTYRVMGLPMSNEYLWQLEAELSRACHSFHENVGGQKISFPGAWSTRSKFPPHSEFPLPQVLVENEENKSLGASPPPPIAVSFGCLDPNTPSTPDPLVQESREVDIFQLGEFIDNQSGPCSALSDSSPLLSSTKANSIQYDCQYSIVGCDSPNASDRTSRRQSNGDTCLAQQKP